MNFDPSMIKIHPLIQDLRAEFLFASESQPQGPHIDNHWFCLKPEKRTEYLKKSGLYSFSDPPPESKKPSGPLSNWIPGYARKSGESIKPRDELKIVLTRFQSFQRTQGIEEVPVVRNKEGAIAMGKPCSVVRKIRKPEKTCGKKFIIEIDE